MAEKQRRDNLNTNISTMAALLPTVAGSSRKMDKISILRLAAAFLRTQYTLGHGSTNFLPRQFNEFDLEQYFVDQLIGYGGFFLVLTTAGKIVYVSRQVEQHLGHAQNELLGQSLYNFVHSEDYDELKRNLTPDGQPTSPGQTSDLASDSNSSSSSEDATSRKTERPKFFREQRRSFKIRMSQRTVSRREHTQYEHLNISGILRLAEACKNMETNEGRGRHREMTSTSNDIVFAGIASLPRSITELSIIDANKDEYVTRHLVDGRIIFCDHRVSIVAGYLSEEVSGRSAFSFMHKDDYKWTMLGLQQMYHRAVTWGSSCYRLLAKSGEFIYLRTHGYLEYDKDTQSFESFVCVNTLMSEEEGMKLIKEMKERYSATSLGSNKFMIQNNENSLLDDMNVSSSPPVEFLEDPTQLETAITHLISDLPSPAVSENHFSPSPMPNMQFVKAAIFSSRLPSASTQANKIGINKIPQHHVVVQNKSNQSLSIKEEINGDTYMCDEKLINSNCENQNRIADLENAKPSSVYEPVNTACDDHGNIRNNDMRVQSNILATRESNCVSRNHMSCLNVSQDAGVLNSRERLEHQSGTNTKKRGCNIKLKRSIDMLDDLDKREAMLQYFSKTANSGSPVVSSANSSHNRLKRICSDEDLTTIRSKKKSNSTCSSSSSNDGRRDVSYVNCRSFVTENPAYPALTTDEFNQYNDANSQPLMTMAEPPNSSLPTLTSSKLGEVDYQQLVINYPSATPLVMTSPDEEQLGDLQDLKDDTLLSSDLDPNPEIMMKIFDDLRLASGFEKNFNGTKIQQLIPDDQAVNAQILRAYQQLASSMDLQESEFNTLARELYSTENPALRGHRGNLSHLQVEHNIQKQMLKTLQQDHHNVQMNINHNMGM